MKNRLLNLFVAMTTFCLMLAFATPAAAQWPQRWQDRDRDSYRDLRFSNIDRMIRQAENRSDQFIMALESRRNRGILQQIFGENERLDRLSNRAHYLETQLNALRQDANRGADFRELRPGVINVLSLAEDINTTMHNRRLDPVVERQWAMLRQNLNQLARVYNLRQLS